MKKKRRNQLSVVVILASGIYIWGLLRYNLLVQRRSSIEIYPPSIVGVLWAIYWVRNHDKGFDLICY